MNKKNTDNNQKISILLIARNEQEVLPKWTSWINQLSSVNEIILVDDHSTDDTIAIVKSLANKNLKVKVCSRGLSNDFASQRNFGISQASNHFILWLDPDEQPSPELIDFLNQVKLDSDHNHSFKRTDFFIGHRLNHGDTGTHTFLRLFDRRQGKFVGQVHEIWQSQLPEVVHQFEIYHYSHRSLSQFFAKINLYTTIRAQELHQSGTTTSLLQIIIYPLAKFIDNYFFRLGFLDGTAGIVFALGMSFHSFLVRAKLWCLLHP